ncbi:MAG: acetate--CoA ligase family protein [Promethearchaeota archaeon]
MPEIFFNPKSIAIIGATSNPKKFGNSVTKNLLQNPNLSAEIYLVSLGSKEINGIKTHSSIFDIPHPIDLAILLVPAKFVPSVVDDCIKKPVKRIIIVTAGFGEMGLEGKKIEQNIAQKCRTAGIRVIGPNCVGIENCNRGMNASFIQTPRTGNISFVSQSGSFGAGCLYEFAEQDMGCAKFTNLGNAIDLSFNEVLEYYRTDSETQVIAIYLESLKDGRKFYKSLQKLAKDKPVVVLKGGRTSTGLAAAESHTGSIASNYIILKTAVEQAGGVMCESMSDYIAALKTFSYLPNPKGNRIGILTSSGGSGVLYSDQAEEYGVSLHQFPEELKNKIRPLFGPLVKIRNPLDMIAGATEENYYQVTKIMLESKDIDIVVPLSLVPPFMQQEPQEHMRGVLRAWNETGRKKPVIPLMVYAEGFKELQQLRSENDFPLFFTPKEAAYSTKLLIDRMKFLQRT